MERTWQWLLDQDLTGHDHPQREEMICMQCTGRGRLLKPSLSQLQLPKALHQKVSLSMLQTQSFVGRSAPKGRAQVLKERLDRIVTRKPGYAGSTVSMVSSVSSSFSSVCHRQASPLLPGSATHSPRGSTRHSTHDSTCGSTRGSTRGSTHGSTHDSTHGSTHGSTRGSTRSSTDELRRILPHPGNFTDTTEPCHVTEPVEEFTESTTETKPRRKTTLFEKAYLDNTSNPIVFETYVKFEGGPCKFQGFSMSHKRTPEHFTMEQDFPSLGAETLPPEVTQRDEGPSVKTSMKDLSGLLLSDGVCNHGNPPPVPADCATSQEEDSSGPGDAGWGLQDSASSTQYPTLYIRNLPRELTDQEQTEFLSMLQYYGNVHYFELCTEEDSTTAKIRLGDEESATLACECFDKNDSCFYGKVLEAELVSDDQM